MRLTYNRKLNIAYLRLGEGKHQVKTIEVGDDIHVDLAEDGTVYGIEFLNANEQLEDVPGGLLSVENEETGAKAQLALP